MWLVSSIPVLPVPLLWFIYWNPYYLVGSHPDRQIYKAKVLTLAMLGYANQELSKKRGEAICMAFKRVNAGLVSVHSIPVKLKLFGDDFIEKTE